MLSQDYVTDLINKGWYLLPVAPRSKRPLVGRGVYAATQDTAVIGRWLRAFQPVALAVACGPSGLCVLDRDRPLRDGLDWPSGLPDTLTARTPRGAHYFYAGSTRNYTGWQEGIDVKSYGGYVVLPFSHKYTHHNRAWQDFTASIQPLPSSLELDAPQHTSTDLIPLQTTASQNTFRGNTIYGLRALESEKERLILTREGQRNSQLNKAAFRMGQLIAAEELSEKRVVAELRTVMVNLGLDSRDIATIHSGLQAGLQKPRTRHQ